MPRLRNVIALLFAALLVPTAITTSASADQGGVPNDNAAFGQSHKQSCLDTGQAGVASCHAQVVTDTHGKPFVTPAPAGYGPADVASAYKLSTSGGAGQTVAIVDAYDDPNAVADLSVYRSQFGRGACNAVALTGCTFANGATIKKLNQSGVQGSYPNANGGWAEEISLDLDMVSGICPNCNILLVEANSSSMPDLAAAVNTAAAKGATAISNSYGGNEFYGETSYDLSYTHAGIPITVSTGDSGYGVEYPASSPNVTAVGGTTLKTASNSRGWTETAWSGAGSGCSAFEPRPSFQSSATTGCSNRAVADVSAVADPNTGVSVYDTYGSDTGWEVFGGTSVASPIIASVYALAGNGVSIGPSYPYSHSGSLFDITSGTNGCKRRAALQLCTARNGWDGPTGLGTPNGTGAF
ncbi:MAG: S53 family peptidase [Acidimicrobiia bacterium]|nr:S53 family peptidase [Acidimicrobiia bacterium]